jgi:autotransporter-associated beta strand protein
VRFDDAATGTNFAYLTTTLTPGSLTVDNSSKDYTFGGTGKISGSTGLTKTGTRKLTLTESGGDDFIGNINLDNGTLQIGNGGTSGTLPLVKVDVDASATLVFNRSDNLTVAGVISGLGTMKQNGPSVVALNGSNSAFAGQIIVATGTLQPGNTAALGTAAATVVVSNNATLDVNGQKFNNNQPIIVLGAGVAGNGAIVNNSTNAATQILRNVTLTGNTTFGGISDWDIHSSGNPASDAALSTGGSNFKVIKVGTNTVTIFGAQVDGSLGDVDIQAGTLSFERNTTSMGDSSKTVTVYTNATLQFQNASNIWSKVVVLKDGSTIRGINLNEFAGPVTLESGVVTALTGTGAKLTLDSAVGGAGGLTKTGGGSLVLSSASTYAGPTLVSQGSIALINSGTMDSSTNITLSAGTTLDLSALASPTLAVTTGRGLAGSGTVVGNVTMATGSTLTVGGSGTNSLGPLTVTNNLVLQAGSTSLMEVSKVGGVASSDQVVATNVTYGGTLTVTGAGGGFVAGDTFKLFSAGSYGSSFNAINLPTNIVWNTTQLGANGTIQVVSVSVPHISGGLNTGTNFQVTFSGPAGNSYRVWASTNVLASPITNTWTVVASGVINGTGSVTAADNTATNYPMRFYLISVP